MVIKTLKFSDFAIDPKLGVKDYSIIHSNNGIPLKSFLKNKNIKTDIMSGRTPSKFNEDYWDGEYDFLTMQDVDTTTFEVNETVEKITDYAIEEEKTLYLAPENSLIISNVLIARTFCKKLQIKNVHYCNYILYNVASSVYHLQTYILN